MLSNELTKELVGLHSLLYPGIYRYCASRLFCAHLAEDAAAAVFCQLVRRYPQLKDRGEDYVRKWVYGAARNSVTSIRRDSRRQTQIQQALREALSVSDVDAPVHASGDWPIMYAAMEQLRPRARELLTLRYLQGMDAPQIARIMGMRSGAVRVGILRALAQLREALEKSFGPD